MVNRASSVLIAYILAIQVTFFVACADKSNSPGASTTSALPFNHAPLPSAMSGNSPQGTGDGGGGNTCEGRPIESYSFQVQNSEAYKTYVLPRIKTILETETDISRLLTSSIRDKKWYLLPCDLARLPDEKIGSAVKTEQAALQTFTEVWMSEKLFSTMSVRDQADLLLHEMLMGLRLLKFESFRRQCLSFAPPNKKTYCNEGSDARRGRPLDLTPDDYGDIRKATIDILAQPGSWTPQDLEYLLGKYNFSFEMRGLRKAEDRYEMTGAEFMEKVKRAQISKYLPEHSADSSCRVEFAFNAQDPSELKMTLYIASEKAFEDTYSVEADARTIGEQTRDSTNRSLKSFSPKSKTSALLKEGDSGFASTFYLDENDLAVVEIKEFTCVGSEGQKTCTHWVTPKNHRTYLCADSPSWQTRRN